MNCRICNGSGLCATCNGLGDVLNRADQYEQCADCDGAAICPWCDGYGDAPDAPPRRGDRAGPIASYRRIAAVAS